MHYQEDYQLTHHQIIRQGIDAIVLLGFRYKEFTETQKDFIKFTQYAKKLINAFNPQGKIPPLESIPSSLDHDFFQSYSKQVFMCLGLEDSIS